MKKIANDIKNSATKDGFKPEEVDALLNQTAILVGKVVKDYLIEIIKLELTGEKCSYLLEQLEKIKMPDYTGCEQIEFKGVKELKLNIKIKIANKEENRFDIIAPNDEAVRGIFFHVARYMDMANAFYLGFIKAHEDLYKKMCEYMPKINFSSFALNQKNYSIAFDDEHPRRIVPSIFYTNPQGQLIDVEDLKIKPT